VLSRTVRPMTTPGSSPTPVARPRGSRHSNRATIYVTLARRALGPERLPAMSVIVM